jgi:hypothetical protein
MTDNEVKYRAEATILRWFIIMLLVMACAAGVGGFFLEERFRSIDNEARAQHWEKLEQGQARIRGMLDKQYTLSMQNDEHLRQCTGCHSHHKTVIK